MRYWWEIDMSFYVLKGLEAVGLVWDLHVPSEKVRSGGHAITSKAVKKPVELGAPDAVAAPALATSDAE